MNPPANALVLSVDEKPTIQALERASGYVLTSSGKIVHGLKSTYKRHGTVNLFAALEVATGVIRGKTTQTKKRVDFQAFMTDLVAKQPPDREIHVILDNLSTHKNNDHWLAAHPNVTFHFAPTSCKLAQPGGNLVRHLQPKGLGRSQLCQHRATGPGNPRLHRSLQPERSTLRLAQARG
jgi:hypothetical protein